MFVIFLLLHVFQPAGSVSLVIYTRDAIVSSGNSWILDGELTTYVGYPTLPYPTLPYPSTTSHCC